MATTVEGICCICKEPLWLDGGNYHPRCFESFQKQMQQKLRESMSWQDKYRERYEERLRERWTADGRKLADAYPSLKNLIDTYGVVGGRDGEVYLGEDACQEAGLPTVIRMKI